MVKKKLMIIKKIFFERLYYRKIINSELNEKYEIKKQNANIKFIIIRFRWY